MGVVFFFFLAPLIALWAAIKFLGPVLGVFAVGAAILSVVILVVAARVLLRAPRNGLRVLGAIFIGFSIVGIVHFTALAVVAFAASALASYFG